MALAWMRQNLREVTHFFGVFVCLLICLFYLFVYVYINIYLKKCTNKPNKINFDLRHGRNVWQKNHKLNLKVNMVWQRHLAQHTHASSFTSHTFSIKPPHPPIPWLNFDTLLSRSKMDKRLIHFWHVFETSIFDTFSRHFVHISYNLGMVFYHQSLFNTL